MIKGFGPVQIIGSYALDLMTWPDLDINVQLPNELDVGTDFDLGGAIASRFQATKMSFSNQFIHRLPRGYHTLLSERGSNLSHGQRQLFAIARAILADPKILILDEATSSIDTRTEKHIQEAMLRLMAGRTSFVIAHHLSTIRGADQGAIVERGTHQELLDQHAFYQRLYASQLRTTEAGDAVGTAESAVECLARLEVASRDPLFLRDIREVERDVRFADAGSAPEVG